MPSCWREERNLSIYTLGIVCSFRICAVCFSCSRLLASYCVAACIWYLKLPVSGTLFGHAMIQTLDQHSTRTYEREGYVVAMSRSVCRRASSYMRSGLRTATLATFRYTYEYICRIDCIYTKAGLRLTECNANPTLDLPHFPLHNSVRYQANRQDN